MIVFNGIDITSVAPVRIEDIKVSPIRYNPTTRPRPVRFGSEFVRMGGGERTVTISFALLEKDMSKRQESLLALSTWARTDAEYKLELPQDPVRYLECVCTAKAEPSTRAWWENKLKMAFTCFSNPYWTSKAEKSVACGTAFFALGSAPPLMRIEHTFAASATNVMYSNSRENMGFSTIPAGNMVIDLNEQTAAVGGASIMANYFVTGKFLVPRAGAQTITGTGTVKFRERWE